MGVCQFTKLQNRKTRIHTNIILKLKQSQSQSQNSPPNFMNIVKPVNTKEKVAKVMSEESAKQAQTIDDQIEKLRAIIDDNSGSYNPSDNQWKRTEKLQHKLRYLEFFKSYEVDNCPESFKCSKCVEEKVKILWCQRCKEELNGGNKDGKCRSRPKEAHHSWDEKQSLKLVCEDLSNHQKEWLLQEKSRVEVRNCIKRDFDAMIRKERDMRFKTIAKKKIIREQIDEENTEMMFNKNKEKKKKLTQTTIVDAIPKVVETKQKINEMENFHNDQCKTCMRMRDIMGSIMPHPINI